ncbi:tRNA (adenosine(37)-N6)-dimethylallyltransferase MiaA [Candidatus Jorgensenbacteria bacterium]|nr:tRNA (adenosine(37)-N6)-dimethylallyltransferase MiaA [Candidatus Jorgensenbacteria bacterium]
MERKIIVIVGPTASGKSDLAVLLARKFGGEIVSADSRQIYKGLDIGSGKITKKEMQGVPHHLIDIANPRRTFTALQYQYYARRTIQKIWQQNKTPIICGGTGFYIQAVINGLVLPEVKPQRRFRDKLDKKTNQDLFHLLIRKDPARARTIDAKNKRRLIRALEIVETLGRVPPLRSTPIDAKILMIGISKKRDELKKLISQRLFFRLHHGLIKEVERLHKSNISWKRLENLGLEYRFVSHYLQDKSDLATLKRGLNRAIINYAKRQITWFKRDKRINWVTNQKQAMTLTRDFMENNKETI